MTDATTPPDLERVWQHAIMPLLEEHYYGDRARTSRASSASTALRELAAPAERRHWSSRRDAGRATSR